jgi:hypothetical protein
MHKLTLGAVLAIFFFSFFGLVWAQAPTEPTLQQKLDEVNGDKDKTVTTGKEKKNNKNKNKNKGTTPTTAPAGETEREKLIRFRALAIEADANLKQAERDARKAESPALKQAERQVAHEEKQRVKSEREERRVIADAQVTGCEAGNFWVSPKAEPSHWVLRNFQSAVIRVVNPNTVPIEISGPKGVLGRLCGGGAMTMTFFQDLLDSANVPISLLALARVENGIVATAQYQVNLNVYDEYTRVQSQTWVAQLSRQWQVR